MQAIPYGSWAPDAPARHVSTREEVSVSSPVSTVAATVQKLVSENAVIVVGRRGCCMSHVVTRLLLGHGVNPAVFEVDEDDEAAVVVELRKRMTIVGDESVINNWPQFPVVFVGGKLFGGLERVIATHISGELVPVLKEAGALWL
ncbi:putative glutaredoxin-like, plant II, thioredoxin-like protein [Rosa chinensis]|uniref:Putative glutaredoxin-like, plant II, thioredoxin-like protein n=1 Tax=Rosa chinensis TaxID=74649 RepID=A0A2P6Q4F1_ROSCH|nr:glutaredoxin-C9 [Rosa chinensis]PRQ29024.1 putative glutaredoxin-like, plant II, thioredoxin-like protein [Rosa chinensis]